MVIVVCVEKQDANLTRDLLRRLNPSLKMKKRGDCSDGQKHAQDDRNNRGGLYLFFFFGRLRKKRAQ